MISSHKIRMQIQTSDYSQFLQNYKSLQAQQQTQILLNTNKSSLPFQSMINRIHNVRPGCGSCGK